MRRFFLCIGLATGLAAPASGAMLGGDPGPNFDLPMEPDFYHWEVDMTGFRSGDTLLDFTVEVPFPNGELPTFQVFGGCDGSDAFAAGFSLFRDGASAPWTTATRGSGGSDCGYHNLLNQTLPGGSRSFRIVFDGADYPPPDGFNYADVRFGWIGPAVPVPAPALLLLTSIAAIGALKGAWRFRS